MSKSNREGWKKMCKVREKSDIAVFFVTQAHNQCIFIQKEEQWRIQIQNECMLFRSHTTISNAFSYSQFTTK